jgi:hypothetical protein
MLALARRAWAALRAPDPREVAALLAAGTAALPYLGAALRRHLEELPWTTDGLALSERLALETCAEDGGSGVRLRSMFARAQRRERAPWMGDAMFFHVVRTLAEAPVPLLAADGPLPRTHEEPDTTMVRLTAEGETMLAGERSRARRDASPRWVGGVRIAATEPDWRWDPDRGAVVVH